MLPPLLESLGIGPPSEKAKALETRLHHLSDVLNTGMYTFDILSVNEDRTQSCSIFVCQVFAFPTMRTYASPPPALLQELTNLPSSVLMFARQMRPYAKSYIHTCMHACMHACIHTYIHTDSTQKHRYVRYMFLHQSSV